MTLTIRGKILIIAFAVFTVGIGAVIANSASVYSREYANALQSRSLAIGKSLAIQLERLLQLSLDIHDIVGFEAQCREIVRTYPGIDIAMVVSRKGDVLFHSSSAATGLDSTLIDATSQAHEKIVTHMSAGTLWYDAIIPVYAPNNVFTASIVVGFPEKLISKKLRRMLLIDIGVGLIVLILGLLTLYLSLSKTVTRPLTKLIRTVSRLRQDPLDLSTRVHISTKDELGQLGSAFNQLVEDLQHTTVSRAELIRALDELQRLSSALSAQKKQVEVTLHSIGDAVISVNSKALVQYLNPVAEKLCGWTANEALALPLQNVLHLFDVKSKAPLPSPFEPAFFKGEAVSNSSDAEMLRRDGTTIGVDYTASPMFDENGHLSGGVLTLRDVSKERAMTQRLSWEANHDALTGLYNRQAFTERLTQVLNSSEANTHLHSILLMDLDHFKWINESAGHSAGDDFLKCLASTLREHVRPTDTLARLGSDEFALFLENCSIDQAKRVATHILDTVEAFTFDYEKKAYSIGVSIGLTKVHATNSVSEILTMADTACFMAKEQGRNRICIYREGSTDIFEKRRQADWAARINFALQNDQFTLYQQQYLNLQEAEERETIEILLRMREDDDSLIQPVSFLPSAERYNLVPDLDKWVIRKVFSHYHKLLQQRAGKPLTCSINLSSASVCSRSVLEFIRLQAQAHAIPPKAICFEIPEAALTHNLSGVTDFAQGCHKMGFQLAVDDFGKHMNTYTILKGMPIDYLKINGQLAQGLDADAINGAVVASIHHIANMMNITTVAKHAEAGSTLTHLRTLGVDYAQGFGVHVPAALIT